MRIIRFKKKCQKKLKLSIEYMDMPCVFYYVRMIEILNTLIKKMKKNETN